MIQVCSELSGLPADSSVLCEAEYKLMLAHLREPGASLSVIPEGIAGIFLQQEPFTEAIFLSKRKGFVRLAIQAGAGEQDLHRLEIVWMPLMLMQEFCWSPGKISLISNAVAQQQADLSWKRVW